MALAAARVRALRALSRPRPPGRLPAAARSCCSPAGAPGALPPGGYRAWQERAARDPAGFWADVARGWLRWDSPFHTACQPGAPAGPARWFLGGRLNVSGKASSRPRIPRPAGRRTAGQSFAGPVFGGENEDFGWAALGGNKPGIAKCWKGGENPKP